MVMNITFYFIQDIWTFKTALIEFNGIKDKTVCIWKEETCLYKNYKKNQVTFECF